MENTVKEKLEQICENVKFDEAMKNHTTFRIGGLADAFVSISSEDELREVLSYCREASLRFYIIGNGSNLLFSDDGFRGVIIEIGNRFSDIRLVSEDTIYAQSGVLLSKIAMVALNEELKGFEFASGIPGTLGGGVVMNAGAYGGELKDVIISVKVLDRDGNIREIDSKDMEFSYRSSIVEKEGFVVLGAYIKLSKGDKEEIKNFMNDLNGRRREKQPLEYPSAGSTFKRPEGYFAGKLIEDCNLKGSSVGGACVSEKHAGFVINKDNAKASDVIGLIDNIRKTVRDTFGVELEPEVKIIK